MPKIIKIDKNDKFGRLTVIKELKPVMYGKVKRRMFLCKCTCKDKTIVNVMLPNLRSGNTKSCGCYQKEKASEVDKTTHGLTYHPLYNVYLGMLSRCYNINNQAYKNYGDRGIKVCKEWKIKKDYRGLKNFIYWNESLPESKQWRKGLELDRKNNNKGYEPSNCRWVTTIVNARNKRSNVYYSYKGKNYTLRALHEKLKCKIPIKTVENRIYRDQLHYLDALTKAIS